MHIDRSFQNPRKSQTELLHITIKLNNKYSYPTQKKRAKNSTQSFVFAYCIQKSI